MYIGLKLSDVLTSESCPTTSSEAISSIISEETDSVAFVHMSTTLLYFSPSVISPSLYCFSIFPTSRSASSMICCFLFGVTISFLEIEMPDIVAYLYPISLSRSARITVALVPRVR